MHSSNSDSCSVNVEMRGAIAIVRYGNNPTGLISNRGAAKLHAAITPLLESESVRALILTGMDSDVFIRHADIGQILRAGTALANGQITADSFVDAPFPNLCSLLDGATKPIIAAINGCCMGGGLEIALACTIRVTSEPVKAIGLPEIRLGIFPGSGGTQRLPRIMGLSQARLFMLEGSAVCAQEACKLGLVDDVAPCSLTRALKLAQNLVQREPAAIAAVLQLTSPSIDAAMADEQRAFAHLLQNTPTVLDQLRRFIDDGRTVESICLEN